MRYILDRVHHNPGEAPLATAFTDPAHLADYGFNSRVFKHRNCVAAFAATGIDCFPAGSTERAWLDPFTARLVRDIAAVKARGLQVFSHLDLFVRPRPLTEHDRALAASSLCRSLHEGRCFSLPGQQDFSGLGESVAHHVRLSSA